MQAEQVPSRRKFPRRRFRPGIGFLKAGEYVIGMGVELGEGGLSLKLDFEVSPGSQVVLSFQIPESTFVTVIAQVRDCRNENGAFVIGCQFENIAFEQKRQIRSYVSARTMLEN